nr:MFS transporter [Cellulosimicrobium sp. MM]
MATVTDRAVARLNVFTYAGAVLGGVLTGVFATAHHLRVGFVVLAVLAAVSAVLASAFRRPRRRGARERGHSAHVTPERLAVGGV